MLLGKLPPSFLEVSGKGSLPNLPKVNEAAGTEVLPAAIVRAGESALEAKKPGWTEGQESPGLGGGDCRSPRPPSFWTSRAGIIAYFKTMFDFACLCVSSQAKAP